MYDDLIGKYLNGYKIVKIEKDPFIKGQINLWTDEERTDYWGDRSIVKFFLREDSNSNKIYQELIDKQIYDLKNQQKEFIEYLENEMNKKSENPFEDGLRWGFQSALSKYKNIVGGK